MLIFSSKTRSIGLVLFACLQAALLAGIIYGWASISTSLLIAPLDKGGANLKLNETTNIFAMASSTFSLASMLLGLVLDRFGPRICSLLSHLCILLGCLVLASIGIMKNNNHYYLETSSSSSMYALCWYGANLLALGGPGIQTSCIHVANLFTQSKFLVTSIICGSITFSFAILAIFDYLWQEFAIGIGTLFGFYAIVVLLSGLGSHIFWPNQPFEGPFQEQQQEEESIILLQESNDTDKDLKKEEKALNAEATSLDDSVDNNTSLSKEVGLKQASFWKQLCSGSFLRNVLVFILTSLLANIYVAYLPIELADQGNFTFQVQHDLARQFTLIMSTGMLWTFAVGWAMDRYGLEVSMAVMFGWGMLQRTVLILQSRGDEQGTALSSQGIMTFGFVAYLLFRQFQSPVFIAFLLERLGNDNFGTLCGIGFFLSGIIQLGIAPIVEAVQGTCHSMSLSLSPEETSSSMMQDCHRGHWFELHVAEISTFAILLIVPILEWMHHQRRQQSEISQQNPLLINDSVPTYGSTPQGKSDDSELIVHV